jgi:acylpyruvate hydrolase
LEGITLKLVSFKFNGRTKVGAGLNNIVVDLQAVYAHYLKHVEGDGQADELSAVLIPDNMLDFLRNGERSHEAAKTAFAYASTLEEDCLGINEEFLFYPLEQVKIKPPYQPETVLLAGPGLEDPSDVMMHEYLEFFLKAPHTVVGPEDSILYDANVSEQFDSETHLGVIIGKPGRFIEEEDVRNHIYGYIVVNNIVARDKLQVGWEGWMWHVRYGEGASFDNSAPTGPYIVTKDEVEDHDQLTLRKYVNGQLVEEHRTSDLLRKVDQFVSYLSTFLTLEPGILISTGSPGGWVLGKDEKGNPVIKAGKQETQFLKPGDVVTAEIESVGTLTNPVVRVETSVSTVRGGV